MTALRPYQEQVIGRFEEAVASEKHRVLMVAPTGAGKTVIAAEIMRKARDAGQRVLFLAHRRELITQCHSKLWDLGIDGGIILAGHPPRPGEPVQIASVQTLWARAVKGSAVQMPNADLAIIDEAHHARAMTYKRIVEAYPEAVILGLTATPVRGDGKGLGNIFDVLIECPQVQELINLGYLVPSKVFAPTRPDLRGVRVQAGDYVEAQLAERMDTAKLVGDVISHWHRLAERRKSVIFACGVAHSVHLRDEFIKSGIRAEHIAGTTPKPERDEILKRLDRGELDLVSNAMVLTEGWDCPGASCCVLARPTKHMGLYRQMIGRVLRPAPGKDHALIIDHAGAVFEHGLPEDAITWTLDEDTRAENPAHASRMAAHRRGLTTCPHCSATRMEGDPCRVCRWKPEARPREVDVIEGDLGLVERGAARDRIYGPAEREAWHRQLAHIASERGYKPGWAAANYREKFGAWPTARYIVPERPSIEVTRWVRSRLIAYAKSRKAATR